MFVIPCKFHPQSPIFSLIKSIRKYYPNEIVAVIDSNSADTAYLRNPVFSKYQVVPYNAKNKNWVEGAIWYAFRHFPQEEWYKVLHDTTKIVQPLPDLTSDFYSINFFPSWTGILSDGHGHHGFDNEYQVKWATKQLKKLGLDIANFSTFNALFGNMMLIRRDRLEFFRSAGLHRLMPRKRDEECACERIWGMILHHFKIPIDVQTINGNLFISGNDGKYIQKFNLSRT